MNIAEVMKHLFLEKCFPPFLCICYSCLIPIAIAIHNMARQISTVCFSVFLSGMRVCLLPFIYTDLWVNTTSFKLVLVIQPSLFTSNLHRDLLSFNRGDVKGSSLYSSVSEWGSVVCHCVIFLNKSFFVINLPPHIFCQDVFLVINMSVCIYLV